jgi:hypothetical protein
MMALCNLQMGINQIAGMKILFPIRTWKSQAIPSPLSLRKFCQDASIFKRIWGYSHPTNSVCLK